MSTWLRQLLLFALAGALAFLVDTAVLYALKGALGLVLARVVSFITATVVTWLINRRFTFAGHASQLGLRREFSRYTLMVLAGGLVNYFTYLVLVLQHPVVAAHPVLGVAAGSVAGMLVNFLLLRTLLFRHSRADGPAGAAHRR